MQNFNKTKKKNSNLFSLEKHRIKIIKAILSLNKEKKDNNFLSITKICTSKKLKKQAKSKNISNLTCAEVFDKLNVINENIVC